MTGTVNLINRTGIWANTSGSIALVARVGDPAPDANGTTSANSPVFASLEQFVLPEQGGAIILATLKSGTPGGVLATNNRGIWAVDTGGVLKQIIRTGSALTANGKARIVATLMLFIGPAASTGQTRHFNNPGDVIYKVAFTDGSTGIAQSIFP